MTDDTEMQDIVPEADPASLGPDMPASDTKRASVVARALRHAATHRSILRASLFLKRRSDAFSWAKQLDEEDVAEFIRTVNCRAMAHGKLKDIPEFQLVHAVGTDGTIEQAAELYHFGEWLLVKGKPGVRKRPGNAASNGTVFKTVAALAAEYRFRELVETHAGEGTLPSRRWKMQGKVTRTALRECWAKMYGESLEPDRFTPMLQSAGRLLEDYLNHLSSKPKDPGLTGELKSPLLRKVLDTMKGKPAASIRFAGPSLPAGAPTAASAVPVSTTGPGRTATLASVVPTPPINILLVYSSNRERDEHRAGAPAASPTALRYRMEPAHLRGAGTAAQRRFNDATRYVPDVAIRGNYSVKALIDRMVVLIVTRAITQARHLRNALFKGDINTFVADQMDPYNSLDWKGTIKLAPEMRSFRRGRVFAILVQEPTPEKLVRMLRIVDDRWGIVGPVRPFLIEVALDFHARKHLDPQQRLILREQMVGLLQRHHHCVDPGLSTHQSDARQLYRDPKGTTPNGSVTDFLFSSANGNARIFPDMDVRHEVVRERLRHGRHENQLFLNATLYKGTQAENLLFRIQHKIEDRRNRQSGTSYVLPAAERRARIEVEISGYKRLADDLNLVEIGDLTGFNFRTIRNRYLEFWLCCAPDDVEKETMMRKQFIGRGIYGTEALRKLADYDAKALRKACGAKASDRNSTEVMGTRQAWTECNEVVGDAMDALTKAWKRFSWPRA